MFLYLSSLEPLVCSKSASLENLFEDSWTQTSPLYLPALMHNIYSSPRLDIFHLSTEPQPNRSPRNMNNQLDLTLLVPAPPVFSYNKLFSFLL